MKENSLRDGDIRVGVTDSDSVSIDIATLGTLFLPPKRARWLGRTILNSANAIEPEASGPTGSGESPNARQTGDKTECGGDQGLTNPTEPVGDRPELCGHANENPWWCHCDKDCYCRSHTCKDKK